MTSYELGFCKKAEEYGVDPDVLHTLLRKMAAAQVYAKNSGSTAPESARSAVYEGYLKPAIENNPHGTLDAIVNTRDDIGGDAEDRKNSITWLQHFGDKRTGFWNPTAGALTPEGTNLVNRISSSAIGKKNTMIPITPKSVNNFMSPILDSNGKVNAFGTNTVNRIINNGSKLNNILDGIAF